MSSRIEDLRETREGARRVRRQDARGGARGGARGNARGVARWLTGAAGCLALLGAHGIDLLRRAADVGTGAGLSALDGDPALVVEALVVAVGIAVSLRITLAALLAISCGGLRRTGRAWASGERWARRLAPRLMRGALIAAIGSGIALAGSPAWAVHDPAPAPLHLPAAVAMELAATAWSAQLRAETPDTDLGWGTTVRASAPTGTDDPPSVGQPAATAAPATTAPATAALASTAPVTAAPAPVAPATPAPGSAAPSAQTPVTTAPLAPVPATDPGTANPAPSVTVVAGDNLWAITAAHLPADASDQTIAEAWPRWYEENRGVIGADPNLIVPGQVLVIPAGLR